MNALEIHGLTKRRGDFVLRGLELTLPAGCIMGLIGENGAGKSTTIRLILNALSRDGGTVAVYGKDNRALTPLEREDIGVVLDEVGLPEYMNAQQIGRMMAGIFTHWQPEAYAGYLRRLALPEDKPFRDFSRGMKMKQGLAVALSHQPKLLLLAVGLGVPALMFPVMFKFGATKGRAVYIAVVMIASATCGVLMASESVRGVLTVLPILPVIIITLAIFVGSWALSVKWFKAREL